MRKYTKHVTIMKKCSRHGRTAHSHGGKRMATQCRKCSRESSNRHYQKKMAELRKHPTLLKRHRAERAARMRQWMKSRVKAKQV